MDTHTLPPSQHVTLLGFLQNQHKLIDTVDFVFDVLDQRTERIGDVINQSIRDPIRGNVDVILQLLDASAHVLRVGRASEVKL